MPTVFCSYSFPEFEVSRIHSCGRRGFAPFQRGNASLPHFSKENRCLHPKVWALHFS
jgi:hypothetical protein